MDFFFFLSNGTSTSGGTHSSKEKSSNVLKVLVMDGNKKLIPSLNKINIKPIKNKKF